MVKKRITLFANGLTEHGKVIACPKKWQELLEKAEAVLALKNQALRVFNEHGGEIDDIDLIQNNDVLYISDESDFRKPGSYNGFAHSFVGSHREQPLRTHSDVARASEIVFDALTAADSRTRTAPSSPAVTPKRVSLAAPSAALLANQLKSLGASPARESSSQLVKASSSPSSTSASTIETTTSSSATTSTTASTTSSSTTTTTRASSGVRRAKRKKIVLRNKAKDKLATVDDWVNLNVGGRLFTTTRATLTVSGNNMLAYMFGSEWESARDASGAYLIDRTPEYFVPLLNYLRCGQLCLDPGVHPLNVLEEARFFGLVELIPELERLTQTQLVTHTRKELQTILLSSTANTRLRARGMNFEHADLSNLDLSGINLTRAKLAGADLSHTLLDGVSLQEADLTGCNITAASLRGANLGGANLENACLRGVNLADNGGVRANLESANLKNCNLEDAIMSGGNFRCCNFKNANLANADLGRSDLAGSNLEGANLRGANLGKSNLIGANLRKATFDQKTGL